tara:strand:- start:5646 stop:6581 length:936 start_codon:yes stop_codon:yes gene_type:complete
MAQQTIAVGSVANDGTGDFIRDAFVKVNSNFDEIYADNFITNARMADASVKAVELATTNTATSSEDNYILTYDHASGGFTWSPPAAGDGTFTVANEADNRIITSTTATNGNAEANLTFDGTSLIAGGDGSSGGVTVTDGQIDIRTGTGSVAKMKFYCESSNAHAQTLQAQPHSAASSAVLTLPSATGTLVGTGDTSSVTGTMLGAEFTASQALSSGTTVAVNTNLADVFTLTLGHSATLNFTNVAVGDLKTIIITGGGGSYTLALGTINTASATYNKISGTYSDTSSAKNLLQIKFISTTEAWYSYSQIAS